MLSFINERRKEPSRLIYTPKKNSKAKYQIPTSDIKAKLSPFLFPSFLPS